MKITNFVIACALLLPSACDAKRAPRDNVLGITQMADAEGVAAAIDRHQHQLHGLLSAEKDEIFNGDPAQNFQLELNGSLFYVVPLEYSSNRPSLVDSCALTILNKSKKVLDARPTFDAEDSSWACDGLSGIAFRRNKQRPNLIDIIVIYQGRPASNRIEDLFDYPVKLAFDTSRLALFVDEKASSFLLEKNVKDVKTGFRLLSQIRD